jgi:hypothetical protein
LPIAPPGFPIALGLSFLLFLRGRKNGAATRDLWSPDRTDESAGRPGCGGATRSAVCVPSEGPADIWAVAVSPDAALPGDDAVLSLTGAGGWPAAAARVAAGFGGAADAAPGAEAAGVAGRAGGLISVFHGVFVAAAVSRAAMDAPDGRGGAPACD